MGNPSWMLVDRVGGRLAAARSLIDVNGPLSIALMFVRAGRPGELEEQGVVGPVSVLVDEVAVFAAHPHELALPPGDIGDDPPSAAPRLEGVLDPVDPGAGVEVLDEEALAVGVAASGPDRAACDRPLRSAADVR